MEIRGKNSPFILSLARKTAVFLLGAVFCALVLEAALQSAGALNAFLLERGNLHRLRKKEVVRVLCLGDSMTARGYPSYLEKYLNWCSVGTRFVVIDKGETGVDTRFIRANLESYLDEYRPDIVIVMIGIPFYSDEVFPYEENGWNKLKLVRLALTLAEQLHQKQWLHKLNETVTFDRTRPAGAARPYEKHNRIRVDLSRADEYYAKRDFRNAGQLYREAVEKHPESPDAFVKLATVYQRQDRYDDATNLYVKAAALHPGDLEILKNAGIDFTLRKRYRDAEPALLKALELDGTDGDLYLALSRVYVEQGRTGEAKELLSKAVKAHLLNDRVPRYLGVLCLSTKEYALADSYFAMADDIAMKYADPAACADYRALARTVLSRKIHLVCMQYPMRSIKPLKKMLQPCDGILFVDNEKVFEDALKRGKFNDYFRDQYGGDFGHLTRKGMIILTLNAGNTLLEKLR
ncbi:MAG: tetratricopeptide repeat protein [Endomicrobiales bacterium]